jgi:chaperone required for assembly of F1-ATPase
MSNEVAAANLNEIYNMIKKGEAEEAEEDEEDLESIQKANEMFNSMIMKGNQVEDLLVQSEKERDSPYN